MEGSTINYINRNDELDNAIVMRFPTPAADKIKSAMQNKDFNIAFKIICKQPRKYEYTHYKNSH